ncbi:MAG: hypothetical protein RIS35_2253 [Pseudomonadota bacterium]|jgi:hypothetical protein
MKPIPGSHRRAALALCVAGLLLPAAVGAQTQPPGGERPATAAAATDSQAQARAILMRMAGHLASAPRFSVAVRGSYDTMQESGEKIEFGENRTVTMSRGENRLRVDGEHSDGTKVLTVFDGKQITLVDRRSNVFATAPQNGTIDDAIVHYVRELGVRLPLAALLLSRLPAELERRVQSVDYVEKTSFHGAPAHHLAARTESVDIQVWVADGARPLPLRVVLTYREEPGAPQFRAQFYGWNFAPPIDSRTFSAVVPKGATRVSFAGQLVRQGQGAQPATMDERKEGK